MDQVSRRTDRGQTLPNGLGAGRLTRLPIRESKNSNISIHQMVPINYIKSIRQLRKILRSRSEESTATNEKRRTATIRQLELK